MVRFRRLVVAQTQLLRADVFQSADFDVTLPNMPPRRRAKDGSPSKPASDPLSGLVERVLHRHGLEVAMKLLMEKEPKLLEMEELRNTFEQAQLAQVEKLKNMKMRFDKEREAAFRQAPVEADCRDLHVDVLRTKLVLQQSMQMAMAVRLDYGADLRILSEFIKDAYSKTSHALALIASRVDTMCIGVKRNQAEALVGLQQEITLLRKRVKELELLGQQKVEDIHDVNDVSDLPHLRQRVTLLEQSAALGQQKLEDLRNKIDQLEQSAIFWCGQVSAPRRSGQSLSSSADRQSRRPSSDRATTQSPDREVEETQFVRQRAFKLHSIQARGQAPANSLDKQLPVAPPESSTELTVHIREIVRQAQDRARVRRACSQPPCPVALHEANAFGVQMV